MLKNLIVIDFRQLCTSIRPLHPVLPALVEVYVNSILMPAGKSPLENTNQPISEDEIRAVFSNSLVHRVSLILYLWWLWCTIYKFWLKFFLFWDISCIYYDFSSGHFIHAANLKFITQTFLSISLCSFLLFYNCLLYKQLSIHEALFYIKGLWLTFHWITYINKRPSPHLLIYL